MSASPLRPSRKIVLKVKVEMNIRFPVQLTSSRFAESDSMLVWRASLIHRSYECLSKLLFSKPEQCSILLITLADCFQLNQKNSSSRIVVFPKQFRLKCYHWKVGAIKTIVVTLQVLHQTGGADMESYEPDFLRPLTSCEGDSSRSFAFLEWVHENQARRMRSRSEWFVRLVFANCRSVVRTAHSDVLQVFDTDIAVKIQLTSWRARSVHDEDVCWLVVVCK